MSALPSRLVALALVVPAALSAQVPGTLGTRPRAAAARRHRRRLRLLRVPRAHSGASSARSAAGARTPSPACRRSRRLLRRLHRRRRVEDGERRRDVAQHLRRLLPHRLHRRDRGGRVGSRTSCTSARASTRCAASRRRTATACTESTDAGKHVDAHRPRGDEADLAPCACTRRIPTSSTSPRRATAGRPTRRPRHLPLDRRREDVDADPQGRQRAPAAPSDLSMDPTNPRILYAAFWDHQRLPWQVRSGGPGSGIWKSHRRRRHVDAAHGRAAEAHGEDRRRRVAGESRSRVRDRRGGEGRALSLGRRGQDVAPHERGSPDPGARVVLHERHRRPAERGRRVRDERADHASRSTAGARSRRCRAPHGDNHQLWINPKDSRYMSTRTTAARTVSLDGGEELEHAGQPADGAVLPRHRRRRVPVSPLQRPAGQHVGDHQEPQRRRRTSATRDWQNGPGCESANIGVDRKNPRYVYGGCYQGIFEEMDMQTGPHAVDHAVAGARAHRADERDKYRFNWTSPARRVAARPAT